MKLSTVSWLTAIAVFVATSPQHAVALSVRWTPQEVGSAQLNGVPRMAINPKLMAKKIARAKVYKLFAQPGKQWKALSKLWGKESAWNHKAKNPHSSAYGLAQVLKTPRNSTIEQQVNKGLKYIVHRYGTPERAWAFWKKNGWY